MWSRPSLGTALLWAAGPAAFLAFFYFLPLGRILWTGLAPDGQASEWGQTLVYWGRVLGFTVQQAAVSTAATLVVGLPLAWRAHHAQGAEKRLMLSLLTIPFVMPAVVVGAAFTALVGPNGLLNQGLMSALGLSEPPLRLLHTYALVIIAHLFYNVSVVVRIVSSYWDQLDRRLRDAAEVLGASPWVRFQSLELPLLWPGLLSASLLVFLFCFSSFGVVLILGGLQFTTLEVEIYRQAVSFFDLRSATALALIQLAVTFSVMSVQTRLQARMGRAHVLTSQRKRGVSLRSRLSKALPGSLSWISVSLLLLPLAALAVRSVTLGEDAFTMSHYVGLFGTYTGTGFLASPSVAVRNSFLYGLAAAAVSVVLGICMSYAVHRAPRTWSRWMDPFFLLPLGTSTVTLGLGYILAMGPLRTSPWLVPMAHSLIALPFVLRIVLPSLRGHSPLLGEASATLGAGRYATWRHVDLPLLTPALAVALVFAFLASLGEFGATLLVARPQQPTIPLMIYRALGQPGLANLGEALALSGILMCLSVASMLILDRLPRVLRDF